MKRPSNQSGEFVNNQMALAMNKAQEEAALIPPPPPPPSAAPAAAPEAEKKIRKKKDYDWVEAVYVKRLVEIHGNNQSEAGRVMGLVSTGVIAEAIKNNKVLLHNEMNAKAHVELHDLRERIKSEAANSDGEVTITAILNKRAYSTITPWLEQVGARYVVLGV